MGLVKRLIIFLLIIILLALLSYYYPYLQSITTGKSIINDDINYQKEPAFVTRVVDGDTIETNLGTIRLLGINNLKGIDI